MSFFFHASRNILYRFSIVHADSQNLSILQLFDGNFCLYECQGAYFIGNINLIVTSKSNSAMMVLLSLSLVRFFQLFAEIFLSHSNASSRIILWIVIFISILIPDCSVLCTLTILKSIRNPLIFLRKMAVYSYLTF